MKRVIAMTMAAAALLLACGGGGQPAGSVKVSETEFKLDPSAVPVHSGKVQLYVVNAGGVAHDLVLQDASGRILGRSELIQPGNSAVLTIDNVPAGDYVIFCDVPGHREQGMEGKLKAT